MQTLLFFHLLGAVGLISGIVLEITILVRAHTATTIAQVRAATLNVPLIVPVIVPSVALLVAMGIAMLYVGRFGWTQGWIDVVLLVVFVFSALAPRLIGTKLEALHAMSAVGDGEITPEMNAARKNGACNYTMFMGFFETIAALYVMTAKPVLSEVIAILVAAAVVAVIPSAVLLRSPVAAVGESPEIESPATL